MNTGFVKHSLRKYACPLSSKRYFISKSHFYLLHIPQNSEKIANVAPQTVDVKSRNK